MRAITSICVGIAIGKTTTFSVCNVIPNERITNYCIARSAIGVKNGKIYGMNTITTVSIKI